MLQSTKTLRFVLPITATLAGCLAEGASSDLGKEGELNAGEPDGASEWDPSEDGVTHLSGVFDVGIVPERGYGCPAGSDEIRIRMDDEDSRNANRQSGWIGKTRSDGQTTNTLFVFCRVNGDLFRPLSGASNASDMADDYAVLKLGTTCPYGSQEFWRYFDNQDGNNTNYTIGVITPNTSSGSGTRLHFCLFRYAPAGVSTMSNFPDLGLVYGVFAPSDFYRGLSLGYIRTDDEDSGNANGYYATSDALEAARRIVQPDGSATFLRFARVR
ncbi:MAG TPA: hypothetical protein VNO30_50855 [Kofleriaceae bacterium]|nr:hypothetical protein [Kofleriaceae bacterium]